MSAWWLICSLTLKMDVLFISKSQRLSDWQGAKFWKIILLIVISAINSCEVQSLCSDCHRIGCHVPFVLRDWKQKLEFAIGTRKWYPLGKREQLCELSTLRQKPIYDSWAVVSWSDCAEVVFCRFLCELLLAFRKRENYWLVQRLNKPFGVKSPFVGK
jgi:hypothetical protein